MMTHFGLITCARYAFPPNHLEYCGPLKSSEIQSYLKESASDQKLSELISQFETLYPYLTFIAHENGIADPYDMRVVEAYWVGNTLLKKLSQKSLYQHFSDNLSLKKRLTPKELELLIGKIPKGALAHHTFHVLNIFTRTGHHSVQHTIETMNACRIGWGILKNVNTTSVKLLSSNLILQNGKLALDNPHTQTIDIPKWMHISPTDIGLTYTYHWNNLCDTINEVQKKSLESVTYSAIKLANMTL